MHAHTRRPAISASGRCHASGCRTQPLHQLSTARPARRRCNRAHRSALTAVSLYIERERWSAREKKRGRESMHRTHTYIYYITHTHIYMYIHILHNTHTYIHVYTEHTHTHLHIHRTHTHTPIYIYTQHTRTYAHTRRPAIAVSGRCLASGRRTQLGPSIVGRRCNRPHRPAHGRPPFGLHYLLSVHRERKRGSAREKEIGRERGVTEGVGGCEREKER